VGDSSNETQESGEQRCGEDGRARITRKAWSPEWHYLIKCSKFEQELY